MPDIKTEDITYDYIISRFDELKKRDLNPDKIKLSHLDLLYNIKRAMYIIGIKNDDTFSVERHSFICAMIAATIYNTLTSDIDKSIYWELYDGTHCTITPKDNFITQCLFHDMCETVVGDIPSPIKTDYIRKFEKVIDDKINETLKIYHQFQHKTKAVKIVDTLSFIYELDCYRRDGYDVKHVFDDVFTTFMSSCMCDDYWEDILEYISTFLDIERSTLEI